MEVYISITLVRQPVMWRANQFSLLFKYERRRVDTGIICRIFLWWVE